MLYPFVNNPCSKENIIDSRPYKAFKMLENKGGYKKLNEDERKEINTFFTELRHSETYRTGRYRLLGWIIDFSPFLKTYLVNFKYHGWMEIKAFNKTVIRKNASFPSYVLEIIEKK